MYFQIFLAPKVDLSRFHFFFFWLQIAPAIFPTLVLSDRLHDFFNATAALRVRPVCFFPELRKSTETLGYYICSVFLKCSTMICFETCSLGGIRRIQMLIA